MARLCENGSHTSSLFLDQMMYSYHPMELCHQTKYATLWAMRTSAKLVLKLPSDEHMNFMSLLPSQSFLLILDRPRHRPGERHYIVAGQTVRLH